MSAPDPLAWLLASSEPAARWIALTQLLDLPPDDIDVRRAHRDVVAADVRVLASSRGGAGIALPPPDQ